MRQYIAKRVLLFVPTLILVYVVIFLLMRVIPGDPAVVRLEGSAGEGQYTQEALEAVRKELGTDRPVIVQFLDGLWDLLRLDFGKSLINDRPIVDDLKQKLPVTLQLAVMGALFAMALAVPLGLISTIKQDSWIDYLARGFATIGIAMPTFWVGILVIYITVRFFNWFPPLSYTHLWDDPAKNLQQMALPIVVAGFYDMALIARVVRSSMLEVFREDYVRTARAKGLPERVVNTRHVLGNALLPIVTVSGWQFARLLAGTVIIETIFLIPGIGRFLVESISQRDLTIVQAVTLVVTFTVLFLNLVIDMFYAWLDPRIRYA